MPPKRALHKSLPAIYVKIFNCFCLPKKRDAKRKI